MQNFITTKTIQERRIWVMSDEHFLHNNIVLFSQRPGFSAYGNHDYDLHNELIVQNHNTVVGKNDIVLHLGDIAFNENGVRKYACALTGEHYYIRGNHDSKSTLEALDEIGWKQVEPFALAIPEGSIAFSHYPIYQLPPKTVSVFGHVHNNPFNSTVKHINVSVEVTGYFPVLLARVIESARFALAKDRGNDADKNEKLVLQKIHDNRIVVDGWKDPNTGVPPHRKK